MHMPITYINCLGINLPITHTYLLLRNGKSAQRGSFGGGHPADVRGSFARISWPKTSVRAVVKILEKKKAFWRRRPRPEGADVHDPKGFPKKSVRKSLGKIFVP